MRAARITASVCVVILLVASIATRAQSITPTLAYAVSGTTVTLNWTPAAGATSYELVVVGVRQPDRGRQRPHDVGDGRAGLLPGAGSWPRRVGRRPAVEPGDDSGRGQTPPPANLRAIQSGNGTLLIWDLPSSTVGLAALGLQVLGGPGGGVVQQFQVPVGTSASVPSVPSGTYTVRVIGLGPRRPQHADERAHVDRARLQCRRCRSRWRSTPRAWCRSQWPPFPGRRATGSMSRARRVVRSLPRSRFPPARRASPPRRRSAPTT